MSLTPQELEIAKILSNPVDFAKHYLNWTPRWYQKAMLLVPGNRRVVRCGRRIGKTETMAVFAIWYAFTHPQARIIIVAPYEEHVKNIFRRIRELISESDEVSSCITSDTQHPQTVGFTNKSFLLGFTSGTKSGSQGANIRGQRADWILMDEVDFMDDADIHAILAIALEDTERIGVWASSTPTGARKRFWRWCMNAREGKALKQYPELGDREIPGIYQGETWTEFHFSSLVMPNWDKKKEEEWRIELGEAYGREVMAEFGEEVEGVFPKNALDEARKDYRYYNPDDPNEVIPNALRFMGVDWDLHQATPTITVVEYDPEMHNDENEKGIFRVCYAEAIPRKEFTLDYAVNRIVYLNYRFQPEHIYVDRGMGEYQVERLHKMGRDSKEGEWAYKLDQKVKGIQFAQKIEVKDPATGEETKKDVKPFMISHTRTLFERRKVWISEKDVVMRNQLEGYRVERVGTTGRPTYTNKDEHFVDALCLCVLAVTMERPDISNLVVSYKPPQYIKQGPRIKQSEPPIFTKKATDFARQSKSQEWFASQKIRETDSQTWFKVNDLKAAKEARKRGAANVFTRGARRTGRFRGRKSF